MRDDINKLPLPTEAKSYARRSGLKAMKRQPQSFIDMAAAVSDQRDKKAGFKNTDEVGTVPKAIKDSARLVVAHLLEDEEDTTFEYQVYPDEEEIRPGEITFNIQVPHDRAVYVNKVWVPDPLDETGIKMIETRMAQLAKTRDYPPGSLFNAPWGDYLIHGGTIGRI